MTKSTDNQMLAFAFRCTVLSIPDGDGIIVEEIQTGEKKEIRLLGIDAPEIKKCRKLLQDERESHISGGLLMKLGKASRDALAKLIPPGTQLTIQQEKQEQLDRYGRHLGYAYLEDGKCLNEEMLRLGYAKPYKKSHCQALCKYMKINAKARREQAGHYKILPHF